MKEKTQPVHHELMGQVRGENQKGWKEHIENCLRHICVCCYALRTAWLAGCPPIQLIVLAGQEADVAGLQHFVLGGETESSHARTHVKENVLLLCRCRWESHRWVQEVHQRQG